MLLTPDVQPQVVADVQALVQQELANKGGISATAVKVAYKAVTAFAPGYYQETVAAMIPDMADQLQPFWADFRRPAAPTSATTWPSGPTRCRRPC